MASENTSEMSQLVAESGTNNSASRGKQVDPIELSTIYPSCNASGNHDVPGVHSHAGLTSVTNCSGHADVLSNHNHNTDSPQENQELLTAEDRPLLSVNGDHRNQGSITNCSAQVVQDPDVHVSEDKPLLPRTELNENVHHTHTEENVNSNESPDSKLLSNTNTSEFSPGSSPQKKLLDNEGDNSNKGANSSSLSNMDNTNKSVNSHEHDTCHETEPPQDASNNTQISENVQCNTNNSEGTPTNSNPPPAVIHNHIEPNIVIDSSNGGLQESDSESEVENTSSVPHNDSRIQTVAVSLGKKLKSVLTFYRDY